MVAMGRKGGPRDTTPVDPLTGRVLTPEKPTAAEQSNNDQHGEGSQRDSPSASWKFPQIGLLLRLLGMIRAEMNRSNAGFIKPVASNLFVFDDGVMAGNTILDYNS